MPSSTSSSPLRPRQPLNPTAERCEQKQMLFRAHADLRGPWSSNAPRTLVAPTSSRSRSPTPQRAGLCPFDGVMQQTPDGSYPRRGIVFHAFAADLGFEVKQPGLARLLCRRVFGTDGRRHCRRVGVAGDRDEHRWRIRSPSRPRSRSVTLQDYVSELCHAGVA
jgi:hypothetical protein